MVATQHWAAAVPPSARIGAIIKLPTYVRNNCILDRDSFIGDSLLFSHSQVRIRCFLLLLSTVEYWAPWPTSYRCRQCGWFELCRNGEKLAICNSTKALH